MLVRRFELVFWSKVTHATAAFPDSHHARDWPIRQLTTGDGTEALN